MSVFTSLITEDVGLPSGRLTIRKLAPKHLTAAKKAAHLAAMAEARQMREMMGDVAFERAMASTKAPTTRDPLFTYDPAVLLEHGIVGWSFERDVTREAIEDIDEDTRDTIARAVLKLAKPSLFQTDEEQEAAQKNG